VADRKISDLTALTTPATGDLIPIVDISEAAAADKNKSITVGELLRGAPDGTAAAPGFAFESDGGNGMFLGGTDILAFSTGGSQAVTIDASQRLGVGTSSPGSILDIRQTQTGAETKVSVFNTDTANTTTQTASIGLAPDSRGGAFAGIEAIKVNADFSTNAGRDVALALNTTLNNAKNQAVYITHAGNVGIGTTSPQSGGKLTVNGGLFTTGSLTASATDAGAVDFVDDGRGTRIISYGPDGSTKTAISFSQGVGGGSASEVGRWDSSGRLLVGTTSSSAAASSVMQGNSSGPQFGGTLILARGSASIADGTAMGILNFSDNGHVAAAQINATRDGGTWTSGSSQPTRLVFSTTPDGGSSPSEVMRITSGQSVRIGQFGSSQPASDDVRGCAIDATGFISACNTGGRAIEAGRTENDAVSREVLRWFRGGSLVQTITTTATTVSYPTGSDYRLKENVVDMTGAIDRVKQLSPKRFNFIVEPGVEKDGFIAHELETVVPQAVVGEKDQVDEDGNPVWQGVDHSFMVPLLTGALQEAIAKIEILEQRLSDAGIA